MKRLLTISIFAAFVLAMLGTAACAQETSTLIGHFGYQNGTVSLKVQEMIPSNGCAANTELNNKILTVTANEETMKTIESLKGKIVEVKGTVSNANAIKVDSAAAWTIQYYCKGIFYPILSIFFAPINHALNALPPWVAGVCGVGLFISAMFWVCLLLNPKYVNRGRPYKTIWTDLRLWTIISMTPHVIVYFYFR